MKGKEDPGLFRKTLRFLFVGLWESAYRRKKDRTLYRYRTFGPSRGEARYMYTPRHRWIKKSRKKSSAED